MMSATVLCVSAARRSNDEWLRALAADGLDGDSARMELRNLFVRALGRVLASRGVGQDMCEDFAQDALVRVRERLSSFRGDSQFTTWALAIATRVAFDELRHKRWKDVSFEAITEESRGPVVFDPSVEAGQERTLVRERVLGALAEAIDRHLTERQRAVLSAELQGMPQAEIAMQLGMNRNALYKLAHDARKRVRSQLEAAGISEADVLLGFE
jgi:RNA polymerase sigma-70 factor (ECF subfamily)